MSYVIGHMMQGKFVPGPAPHGIPLISGKVDVPRYQSGTLDPLSDAVSWAFKNQDAWTTLVEWAHQDVAAGGRPSIGLYAELLRRPHFANLLRLKRTDKAFLINNNLRSSLARLLNREYPSLKVPTREAAVDRWTLTNP